MEGREGERQSLPESSFPLPRKPDWLTRPTLNVRLWQEGDPRMLTEAVCAGKSGLLVSIRL